MPVNGHRGQAWSGGGHNFRATARSMQGSQVRKLHRLPTLSMDQARGVPHPLIYWWGMTQELTLRPGQSSFVCNEQWINPEYPKLKPCPHTITSLVLWFFQVLSCCWRWWRYWSSQQMSCIGATVSTVQSCAVAIPKYCKQPSARCGFFITHAAAPAPTPRLGR